MVFEVIALKTHLGFSWDLGYLGFGHGAIDKRFNIFLGSLQNLPRFSLKTGHITFVQVFFVPVYSWKTWKTMQNCCAFS